ncbi:MAG: NAD(P)H-nitrite reductase large subunit [Roseivirga sp.]|jgi:NAD(P)H-nitrite reductase large subunit
MQHIVIIGNGISGITTARHVRKLSDERITVISSETEHFFSRTALMYVYMGHMKYENIKPYEDSFWKKNRIELKRAFVEKIDKDNKTIQLSEGEVMAYDKLVIATGSKPNKFGWPGQDLGGVQGLYSFQDLETMEANTKNIARAVIVGGGLIGIEMAEMLRSRNIPVTFLVREKSFWDNVLPKGESEMINRHILEHHVDLRLSHELKEIVSDDNGRVKSIITGNGEEIQCQFVGLTAGVSPNIDFLKESGIDIKRGILVDAHLKTSVDDIYALGDCAEFLTPNGERKSIEQVWYTGRMMGEALARTLTGQPTQYKPGHWFNSAKFFDIEYQTYGWIFPEPREGEAHFHWQHKEGRKCITINYHEGSRKFLGINNFGIRMRQETFDKWLTEERSIDYVIDHLKQANFDPEFYKRHEKEILKSFKETLQQPQL